eukprot:COSAG02_NODE_1727_length_11182_cov_40.189209_9_plen_1135_part_00
MSAAVAAPAPAAGADGAETHLPSPPAAVAADVLRPAPPSAEERFKRAIDIRVRMFGPNDVSVGEMCNTIGLRLKAEQKLDEAVEYFERAARIREDALGPTDAETLLTRGNLAEALMERALHGDPTASERKSKAPGLSPGKSAMSAPAKPLMQQGEPKKKHTAGKKPRAAPERKKAGVGSNKPKPQEESSRDARTLELRRALDILHDVGSKQKAILGATNPYTLYTRANEWWALTQQPRAVPADFAGAHAQLLEIRAAQVTEHGDGELSPYVQRTDAHLESVVAAREAWMRKHPVYTVEQLQAMNVKDAVKIACKLLGKKEAVLRKMGAGLSITQDEVIQLVMNAPQQVADRELLDAAPTAPVSPVRRPPSARKPAPPLGAAPADSPRHSPRDGASTTTPGGSSSKVDAWVSPSRNALRVLEAARRRLAVTALECRDLPKADLIGQNDVYLELSVDGAEAVHTSIVEDGGATPVWGGGGGETVFLVPSSVNARDSAISVTVQSANLNLPQALQVDVMDKDIKGSDLIGRHTVDLVQMADEAGGSFAEDWCSEGWYDLKDHKGGAAGKVRLVLRWAVPAPTPALPPEALESAGESLFQHVMHGMHHHNASPTSPPISSSPAHEEDLPQWELRTTIMECAGLPKMDRFGKNDVYAAVSVEGVQSLRTSTAEDAGEAPVWKDGEGLLAHILHAAPAALGIRVFDEDVGSADDLIGTVAIPLGPALHYSDGAARRKATALSSHHHSTKVEWEMPPTWFELTAPNAKHKGKSVGRVRVQIVWQLASQGPSGKDMRPWTPEQAHFWATDPSRLLDEVDSFLYPGATDSSTSMGAEEQRPTTVQTTGESAATKIQAVQRGRKGRKKAVEKKQSRAATKIQARQRGKQARRNLGSKATKGVLVQQENDAAAKIQAHARGKQVRRKQRQGSSRSTDGRKEAVVAVPSATDYEVEPEEEATTLVKPAVPPAKAKVASIRVELQDLALDALRERASRDGVPMDRVALALAQLEPEGISDTEAAQKGALIELIVDNAVQDHGMLTTIEQEIAEVQKMDHGLEKAEALIELEQKRRAAAVTIQARARQRAAQKHYLDTLEKREAAAATRIQSVARGRAVRKDTQRKRPSAQNDADGARQARLAHLQQQ